MIFWFYFFGGGGGVFFCLFFVWYFLCCCCFYFVFGVLWSFFCWFFLHLVLLPISFRTHVNLWRQYKEDKKEFKKIVNSKACMKEHPAAGVIFAKQMQLGNEALL